ncbi:MAG: ferredoxin family protein [Deltaproteobacteria bacterium]|nr:ferredoxin family protein [Deltaproteobacteria bacterium]
MPPEIDYEKCTACGVCVDLCAEDVFFGYVGKEGEQPAATHPEACFHCFLCVKECPAEAIWLRTPLTMAVPFK